MAKQNDLVVKMTINSTDFENGLKNAKSSMNRFNQSTIDMSNIFKKCIGAMVKSAGTLGIAISGAALFKTMIKSTQTFEDKWNNTMVACKASFQTFATAVMTSNGDLIRNFGALTAAAREFAEAQDALGSAKISNRYARLTYLNPLNQALANAREPGISKAQKQAYIEEAKGYYQQYANNVNVVKAAAQKEVLAWLKKELPGYNFNKNNMKPVLDTLYLNLINGVLDPVSKRYKEVTSKEFWKGNSLINSQEDRIRTGTALMRGEGYTNQQIAVAKLVSKLTEIPDTRLNENLDVLETEVNATAELISLQKQINRAIGGSGISVPSVKGSAPSRSAVDLIPSLSPISPVTDDTLQRMDALGKKLAYTYDLERMNAEMALEWQMHIAEINSYADAINSLAGAFSAVGNAMGDTPFGAFMSTMGTVAQQIGGLINTYSQLVAVEAVQESLKAGTGIPFPFNIAMIAAAVTSIMSIISSAKSNFAGSFANGGIVGGNSYTGDRLFARVNSGEMILNRAQQAAMFGNSGGNVHFIIEGSQLKGVLDNYDKISNL